MAKKELPFNKGRIFLQLAKGTVKGIIDAVVELITNSDDSFKRDLESVGLIPENPAISVRVYRKVGGQCLELDVLDHASGMSREGLLRAVEYGGETSGFESGSSVRGFLGRGLKESIIALGEGKIITRKNGKVSGIRMWMETEVGKQKIYYDDEISVPSDELTKLELDKQDGTAVCITKINPDIKVPDFPTFEEQLKKHFSLREINSSQKRNVNLFFTSENRGAPVESVTPIKFEFPEGKTVVDGEIKPGVRLNLKEAGSQLDSPKNNPFALAGILVSSEGAILESTLFGHEKDEAALWFHGKLDIPEIATKIRAGEMLVNQNRTGLDWRSPFLENISKEVEKILIEHINRKRKELEQERKTVELTTPEKQALQDFAKLLNEFAEDELEELKGPPINPGEIENIEIRPLVANVLVGVPKTFSVYIPKKLQNASPGFNLEVTSTDSASVQIAGMDLTLRTHQTHKEILVGKFVVKGVKLGGTSEILAALGKHTSEPAKVKVVNQLGTGSRKRNYTPRSSGYIRSIEPDERPDPTQRVYLDKDMGELRVYVNFPGVREFLTPWAQIIKTDVGRVLLGEVVTEGFCRSVSLERSENGQLYDNSIDSFNRDFFRLQRKYLGKIQDFIVHKYPKS